MVSIRLLVLVAHVRLLRRHLDLVKDGEANQQTDGNSSENTSCIKGYIKWCSHKLLFVFLQNRIQH